MNNMKKWFATFVRIGLLLIVVAIIILAVWWRPTHQQAQTDITSGLLGGLIGALLTIVLAWIAWVQLGSLSETAKRESERAHVDSQRSSANFILELKQDFFQEETRTLMHLLEEKWIRYVDRNEANQPLEAPFFKVNEDLIKQSGLDPEIQGRLLKKTAYSEYDLDDLLLGHFEDLAMLREKKVLDMEMIDEMFSWYMETTWDNLEIRRYIKHEQTRDRSIYAGYLDLLREMGREVDP